MAETVAVVAPDDRGSLHARAADAVVEIDSYLDPAGHVRAARESSADAVHPGYGFLSESAELAEAVLEAGLTWIGPPPAALRGGGDKLAAKETARAAGVPVLPNGSPEEVGLPLLVKAAAGGGGRGMRVVREAGELDARFADAAREAQAAFGDASLYVERFLARVRHVEIQVLADESRVLHLGERDCSIQRRNQKLVEESPSPALDGALRARMGEAAVRLCRHVGYRNAGTVEFIVDTASGEFHFMEMNTRVQVEHPVTELVTGVDIVKAQIAIAQGEALPWSQDDLRLDGHALECRINAEDPARDFMPVPGTISGWTLPGGPGIRVDTHITAGATVPPFYDSLLAKVLAWGRDRGEALARMRRALVEMRVEGVPTTLPFHRALLDDARFAAGQVHTRFVETELARQP